jgi:uncharacterized phiE125 gp8 family phage protein
MRRYIVNPPTVEPLTLTETKRWLRVDHGDDDALISGLIKAARERIEGRTGRAILAQTWRIVLDLWPSEARVTLPVLPILSVSAVRVFDAAGTASVLASTLYAIEPGSEPPILAVKSPPNPGRARGGIEIDVVAGYGVGATDCPEPLRLALRHLVTEAYAARGPVAAGVPVAPTGTDVDALILPYRQLKLGRAFLESMP